MHTNENFNGSSFSKEVVNSAIPSLANTPLLAFIEENSEGEQDFSDHRIVLHRSEDGNLSARYEGEYVGLIPESNNAKWEFRMTDSGEMKEYLTVEALMWTKRNDPVDIMKRKGFTSQSMELSEDYTGYYDESGLFHFESFKFFGACLLGNDVLPAMQNSTVELQFSKNNNIQKEIENKLQEFYTLFSNQDTKGGNTEMTKENKQENEVTVEATEVVKDYEKTEVEFENVETTENDQPEKDNQTEEAQEDNSTEETETKSNDDSESDNPDKSTEPSEQFEDDSSTEATEDDTDKADEAESTSDETTEEVENEEVVYEAKFNEVSQSYEQLKNDYTSLQVQLTELQSYKRKREEADLKAKFEGKLSDEEFAQVFTDMQDMELDKVEEKLFALIGKKNFSIESTKTKTDVNKISIPFEKNEQPKPYGGLFEKYQN